ncbi:MAG: PstS family phosphate ABC transporter substrate-binding protein [Microcystis aeruginosa WS75]|nr:PstS family phosphate ABC transporter substrate-binding protein [Microcystis aeruginosa WS75]
MKQFRLFYLIPLLLIGHWMTGCADRAESGEQQVSVDGGAVGFALALAVAEEYQKVAPNARVGVAFSGTGGGFTRLCNGSIDIGVASRVIRESESKACERAGIEYIELPMALDGLALVANKNNKFLKCLTRKELKTLWEAEAERKIVTWDQVNPKFPKERILLFAPPVDAGTTDYFTQSITKRRGNIRSDYTPSFNQNTLIQGVIGNANGFAFAGIAFVMQNQDKVNVVGLENLEGKECVKPIPLENVKRNTYSPLTRPLFIYVSKKELDSKPSVERFVRFFVDNSWKYVDSVGYVSLPDLAYVKTRERFEKRQTGSTFINAKPGEPIINFF